MKPTVSQRLDQLPDNTLIFRFSQTSSKAFYLPYTAPDQQSGTSRPHPARRDIQSIVERSMRETKMQKSVDLEGLERLVAVSRILKEGEAEVKTVEDRVTASMDEDRKLDGLVRLVMLAREWGEVDLSQWLCRTSTRLKRRTITLTCKFESMDCVRPTRLVSNVRSLQHAHRIAY